MFQKQSISAKLCNQSTRRHFSLAAVRSNSSSTEAENKIKQTEKEKEKKVKKTGIGDVALQRHLLDGVVV